ncbi:MAG: hypothetical protein HKN55_03825 [Woeseiaceae bacterium]|nr:hypothetical protein [Woeseiaceae bacterium]
MIHSRNKHALESDQDDKAVAKDVVVQGPEELRREKWGKSPLAEERKLARS